MSFVTIVIATVPIVVVAVLLWPRDIPERMENPEFLRNILPVFKILNFFTLTLRRLHFKNPFFFHEKISQLMNRFTKVRTSELVTMQERHFEGVRALVFTPKAPKTQAALLYFHGGGYALGDPEQYISLTMSLAEQLGCVVISVDYRLAPKHIHPAWQQDVHKVTKYFLDEGHKEFNVDPTKVFLMGDSAGGHIVATLGLQFPSIKAVVMLYPVLQHLTYNTPSYDKMKIILLREQVIMFGLMYFEGNAYGNYPAVLANNHSGMAVRQEYAKKFDLPELVHTGSPQLNGPGDTQLIQRLKHMYEDPLNSPLFGDLTKFPPAFIVTCEYDVLRDDSVMFVRRLRKEKRAVKHTMIHSFHGFINFIDLYLPAQRILGEAVEFIQSHLQE